jgi:hypothetical protein
MDGETGISLWEKKCTKGGPKKKILFRGAGGGFFLSFDHAVHKLRLNVGGFPKENKNKCMTIHRQKQRLAERKADFFKKKILPGSRLVQMQFAHSVTQSKKKKEANA